MKRAERLAFLGHLVGPLQAELPEQDARCKIKNSTCYVLYQLNVCILYNVVTKIKERELICLWLAKVTVEDRKFRRRLLSFIACLLCFNYNINVSKVHIKSKGVWVMKVYQKLALKVEHLKNLLKVKPTDRDKRRISKVQDEIYEIINQYLPSGSGIDDGIKLFVTEEEYEFFKASSSIADDGKVILTSSFHVLDEAGFYDGWINFIVEIIPSLANSFRLRIKGNFSKRQHCIRKNASDIKEYLYDLFSEALSKEIPDIDDVHVCEQLDPIAGETITTYTVVDGVITLILANGKTVSFSGLKEVN